MTLRRPKNGIRPIEPIAPKPGEFGLTPERVSEFESPIGPWLGVLTMLLALVCTIYFTRYEIILFFVPVLLGAGFVTFWIYKLATTIWRLQQPDSESFGRYTAALGQHQQDLEEYRIRLAHWQRKQEYWWRGLSGARFEAELGDLLRERGYAVQFTGAVGDGGVDLVLDDGGGTILVQCKAHKKPIGPAAVRDLFGTLSHRGATRAWLVSTAGFTSGARQFAAGKPIRLIAIREILNS